MFIILVIGIFSITFKVEFIYLSLRLRRGEKPNFHFKI